MVSFSSLPHLLTSEPVNVRVGEGRVANFTVLRAGQADFMATVMYRVDFGGASADDFTLLTNSTLLVFDVGEWMKNISMVIEDDDIPETDEPFYIVLYNATGECSIFLIMIKEKERKMFDQLNITEQE